MSSPIAFIVTSYSILYHETARQRLNSYLLKKCKGLSNRAKHLKQLFFVHGAFWTLSSAHWSTCWRKNEMRQFVFQISTPALLNSYKLTELKVPLKSTEIWSCSTFFSGCKVNSLLIKQPDEANTSETMLTRVLFRSEKPEKVSWYAFNKKNNFHLFRWFCFDPIVSTLWSLLRFRFGRFARSWNFTGVIKDWIKKIRAGIAFAAE